MDWLAAIEASAIAQAMRHSLWLYPIVEIFHIAGFVVLVGAVAMFDLRLLGISKHLPLSALAGHLLPWSAGALLVVVPAGLMMFSAHATEFAGNSAFRLKLALIAAAAINAAVFHLGVFRSVPAWDTQVASPIAARAAGALSLALWAGVIACGRLLAYL